MSARGWFAGSVVCGTVINRLSRAGLSREKQCNSRVSRSDSHYCYFC